MRKIFLSVVAFLLLATFPVFAFGTSSVIDDFDRTDSTTTLGANWTRFGSLTGSDYGILTNVAYNPGAAFERYCVQYWNPASYGADVEVFMTVSTIGTSDATDQYAVYARIADISGSSYDCYAVQVIHVSGAANDVWSIVRYDNGTPTALGSTFVQEITTGNKIGIEIVGSTIKAFFNNGSWSELASRTDSTYSASGRIGWYAPGDVVNWRVNDFAGGTLAAATQVKSVEGVAYAQIKSVEGVAKAQIKTVNGVSNA